jgi:hypothetical protein
MQSLSVYGDALLQQLSVSDRGLGIALSRDAVQELWKNESRPKAALLQRFGNCDQPLIRAVPERPSFLTHCTVEPLRVSL